MVLRHPQTALRGVFQDAIRVAALVRQVVAERERPVVRGQRQTRVLPQDRRLHRLRPCQPRPDQILHRLRPAWFQCLLALRRPQELRRIPFLPSLLG